MGWWTPRATILVIACLAVWGSPAVAQICDVCASGCAHTTVSAALLDTLCLSPVTITDSGVYAENLIPSKSVHGSSALSGAARPTLLGNHWIVSVSGIEIRNLIVGQPPSAAAPTFLVQPGSSLTVTGCAFTAIVTDVSLIYMAAASQLFVSGSNVTDVHRSGPGVNPAAIEGISVAAVSIEYSRFEDCSVNVVSLPLANALTARWNVVTGCHSLGAAWFMTMASSALGPVLIEGNVFEAPSPNNTAVTAYDLGHLPTTLSSFRFVANSASGAQFALNLHSTSSAVTLDSLPAGWTINTVDQITDLRENSRLNLNALQGLVHDIVDLPRPATQVPPPSGPLGVASRYCDDLCPVSTFGTFLDGNDLVANISATYVTKFDVTLRGAGHALEHTAPGACLVVPWIGPHPYPEFTAELWFRVTGPPATGSLLSTSTPTGVRIELVAPDSIACRVGTVGGGGVGEVLLPLPTNYETGWTYVGCSYDGFQIRMSVGFDGAPQASLATGLSNGVAGAPSFHPLEVHIGCGVEATFDEVRLWSIADTSSFGAAFTTWDVLGGNEEGLHAYYRFDRIGCGAENDSSIDVLDMSRDGRDLVLNPANQAIVNSTLFFHEGLYRFKFLLTTDRDRLHAATIAFSEYDTIRTPGTCDSRLPAAIGDGHPWFDVWQPNPPPHDHLIPEGSRWWIRDLSDQVSPDLVRHLWIRDFTLPELVDLCRSPHPSHAPVLTQALEPGGVISYTGWFANTNTQEFDAMHEPSGEVIESRVFYKFRICIVPDGGTIVQFATEIFDFALDFVGLLCTPSNGGGGDQVNKIYFTTRVNHINQTAPGDLTSFLGMPHPDPGNLPPPHWSTITQIGPLCLPGNATAAGLQVPSNVWLPAIDADATCVQLWCIDIFEGAPGQSDGVLHAWMSFDWTLMTYDSNSGAYVSRLGETPATGSFHLDIRCESDVPNPRRDFEILCPHPYKNAAATVPQHGCFDEESRANILVKLDVPLAELNLIAIDITEAVFCYVPASLPVPLIPPSTTRPCEMTGMVSESLVPGGARNAVVATVPGAAAHAIVSFDLPVASATFLPGRDLFFQVSANATFWTIGNAPVPVSVPAGSQYTSVCIECPPHHEYSQYHGECRRVGAPPPPPYDHDQSDEDLADAVWPLVLVVLGVVLGCCCLLALISCGVVWIPPLRPFRRRVWHWVTTIGHRRAVVRKVVTTKTTTHRRQNDYRYQQVPTYAPAHDPWDAPMAPMQPQYIVHPAPPPHNPGEMPFDY